MSAWRKRHEQQRCPGTRPRQPTSNICNQKHSCLAGSGSAFIPIKQCGGSVTCWYKNCFLHIFFLQLTCRHITFSLIRIHTSDLYMDPDPWGPKTWGSCRSGSPTLRVRYSDLILALTGAIEPVGTKKICPQNDERGSQHFTTSVTARQFESGFILWGNTDAVLRIRIRNSVLLWPLNPGSGSGMGKKSGIEIRD